MLKAILENTIEHLFDKLQYGHTKVHCWRCAGNRDIYFVYVKRIEMDFLDMISIDFNFTSWKIWRTEVTFQKQKWHFPYIFMHHWHDWKHWDRSDILKTELTFGIQNWHFFFRENRSDIYRFFIGQKWHFPYYKQSEFWP